MLRSLGKLHVAERLTLFPTVYRLPTSLVLQYASVRVIGFPFPLLKVS